MTYKAWTTQVVKNLLLASCSSQEQAEKLTHNPWMSRWHKAGVPPQLAAYNCCALAGGWKPKTALETPFDGLSISFG